MFVGMWTRLDIDEGTGSVLVPSGASHEQRLRVLQALRPAVRAMSQRYLRTRHVVPGGGDQGKSGSRVK